MSRWSLLVLLRRRSVHFITVVCASLIRSFPRQRSAVTAYSKREARLYPYWTQHRSVLSCWSADDVLQLRGRHG